MRPARSSSSSTGSSPAKSSAQLPSSPRSLRGRRDAVAEIDRVAVAQPPRVADERAPAARPFALVQRRADPRLAATALELRGDDAGVVEDQQVAARAAAPGRSATPRVARRVAVEHQQPRRVARGGGAQRDAVGRQRRSRRGRRSLRGGALRAAAAAGRRPARAWARRPAGPSRAASPARRATRRRRRARRLIGGRIVRRRYRRGRCGSGSPAARRARSRRHIACRRCTRPNTVYFLSRRARGWKTMKNWLLALFLSSARAADTAPRTWGR